MQRHEASPTRPAASPTRPEASPIRPEASATRPGLAVSISTIQVLIDGPALGGPSIRDQEPDFTDLGANPNRRSGGRGPLRPARGSLPKVPAGFGVAPMDLRAAGARP